MSKQDNVDFAKTWRWLAVQRARTIYAEKDVDWTRTRVLITDYDRGIPCAPFVIAARARGIETVTLLHGDPNPTSYVPFLAAHVSAWSPEQASVLKAWDPAAKLHVTGAHWIASKTPRASIARTALFVHTGVDSFGEFTERVDPTMRQLAGDGVHVRLRPHPSHETIAEASTHHDISPSGRPLIDDLRWAAEVFCGPSSVAIEAAYHGCLVAVEHPRELLLASLEGVVLDTHPMGPRWRRLVPPAHGEWPFVATDGDALKNLLDSLVLDLLQ